MKICNAGFVNCLFKKRETNGILESVKPYQENNRTDQVEIKMHHRRAACILGTAKRRQKCRDTSTDILSEYDRHRCRPRNRASRRQRLQNTNRCRGRLNDRRNDCTHKHAKDRIGNRCKQAGKLRQIRQRRNCRLHGRHADKQNAKTKENISCRTASPGFSAQHQQNAAQYNQISKVFRFNELQKQAAFHRAARIQPQDLRCNRCTDISAHNHADRLPQAQNSGIDKSDHHDGRCRRRLDNSRNSSSHQQSAEQVACHAFQGPFEGWPCGTFQAAAHDGHAIQEQGKTACHPHNR